jgi:hypothetical protein
MFSLRTLFLVVALAAIFAAALIHPTTYWAISVALLSATTIILGTFGVWRHRYNRTFWMPFCFVGWLFIAFAVIADPPAVLRVVPSSYIEYLNSGVRPWLASLTSVIYMVVGLYALAAACVAGTLSVFASFLLRHKSDQSPTV